MESPKIHWKRNIILYMTSQTISLFGSSLVQYAIMWYITLETKSGVMMTLSILCGFLPTFFLSPFAGVWADRYNRKVLIMISDSLIALSTLTMALLFLSGFKAMWLLFVISAVRAFGTAVHSPSSAAFIPQLVPEDQLTRVNGTNSSIQAMTMLISPMVSGALLTMAPLETILFIDVVTAAIGVLTLLIFLKVPPHEKALNKQEMTYVEDLKLGFDYIKSHHFVKVFFVFCGIMMFLAAPPAFLTPLQVTRTFGSDVWRLTAIEISFSIGMILGGGLMASWGGFKNRTHTMILSCLMMGAFTVLLGIVPNFWVYLFFMALIGVSMPMFNTPSMVLLQEKVEENYLGRVFGVLTMITSSMMPLGMLIFGPLADLMPIEWLLVFTGTLTLIECYFMAKHKTLVKAGEPKTQEEF